MEHSNNSGECKKSSIDYDSYKKKEDQKISER